VALLLGLPATTGAANLLKLEIFSFALADEKTDVLLGVCGYGFVGELIGDAVGEALIGESSAVGTARFLQCWAAPKHYE
jgi:hypothetical protein